MSRFSYRERDYAFGQTLLTLRTAIRLTQAGLADYLGVSRQAVGDWEAGSSYPKAEHLKAFIALAVQRQAFHAGHEAEEIRAFWKAARQKVLLDETWLGELLDHDKPSGAVEVAPVTAPAAAQSPDGPRVDWGDALLVPTFYGRERELAMLEQWIVQERCRIVSVLGMGGIGKSALVVHAMRQLAAHFQVIIFRSLRNSPPCDALLDDILQVHGPQLSSSELTDLGGRLRLVLNLLREQRVLLVLDNVEAFLEEGDARGRLRAGFEGYARLLREVAETAHQSCLLLTARERPADLRILEGRGTPVRSLRLDGLDASACAHLLKESGVIGSSIEQAHLAEWYGGNPLALKIVAETVLDLFEGDIGPFVAQDTLVFGGIADVIREQVRRLSTLELTVLRQLAMARQPITLDELRVMLVPPPSGQMLEAIDGLRRRSLVERGHRMGTFTLHPMLLEYVTVGLVAEVAPETQQGQIERLEEHYRQLVESISEGVSTVTLDGVITSLSPAFENLIGWPTTQLIGSHIRSILHPADLPLAIDRLQRERNGQRQPPTKLRLLQSSGEYRPVEVSSQPEVEGGSVTGAWVLVRDLTKDEQLERQEEEIAQEKGHVQSLIDLIRTTSAKVRPPLTAVNLTTTLLSRQVTDSAALSTVENIEHHVQHMTQLIERVLTMAELDADRAPFSFGPVPLNRLVAYIQTSMHSLAEAKKIAFTVKPTDDLPPVRADEFQLYRAIQEVVANALEYTPEDGSVTVRTLSKNSYGVIEVQDSGIGIAPEMMPHLFERFYHFSLPTSDPGKLGLGLPIAKKIIDKHGGTIDVVSTPSKGSTITIAIPLYRP